MADTGAPWNLPYPLDTDLVIDGASVIQDLAEAVGSAIATVDTAATDNVELDFATNRIITRAAAGTVVFTGTNYTAGRSVTVRVAAGTADSALTFPSGWDFVSLKPTTLAANKTGILATTSFGTTEGSVAAAWAAEF